MSLSINRSALIMQSSERMHALVNDVASYPQFLPWCSGAVVLEQDDDFMLARLDVSKGRARQSFTTRNDLSVAGCIKMDLVEGPFIYLKGAWEFKYLQEDACKVILTLDFEMTRSIAKMAFGPLFNQAASTMVDAFCARAKQIYG